MTSHPGGAGQQLPGKTQGPWDDQEHDGACKATQNCWIALGQQLTIKSRDVHVRE